LATTFTVERRHPWTPTFLALDADGDTIARSGRSFVADFELRLRVRDRERVVIDLENGPVTVNGVTTGADAGGVFDAFAAAGGDNVTLFTPATAGVLALADLALAFIHGDDPSG
jgi:hypothetical protein